MYDTKTPWSSLGIMSPLITMIVYLINKRWPTLGLGIPEVAALIDQLGIFVAGIAGIYGRWRATVQVTLSGK